MIDKYNEAIDDFIKNHLNWRDFAYLVLPANERLRHEAMTVITDKFRAFWCAREGESDG